MTAYASQLSNMTAQQMSQLGLTAQQMAALTGGAGGVAAAAQAQYEQEYIRQVTRQFSS